MKKYLILTRDDWAGLIFVIGFNGRAKEFNTFDEAVRYCEEMEITQFQIIEICI